MKNVLIVWADIHETGIPIIDEQHRGIVSTINSLFYFMRKQRGQDVMAPTLLMLEQYTKVHFLTEETLLEAAGYPGLETHRQLHRGLIDTMFRISLLSKRSGDPDELLAFLKDWWLQHINGNDRAYAPFLVDALHAMGDDL
jgi:hemerythrin-like metal-binding domain